MPQRGRYRRCRPFPAAFPVLTGLCRWPDPALWRCVMLAGASAATPAVAQFDQIFRGSPLEAIFGGPPPRPPSDVPSRPPYPGRSAATRRRRAAAARAAAGIADPRRAAAAASGLAAQRQPAAAGAGRPAARPAACSRRSAARRPPSNTAPQPGDEVVVEPSATQDHQSDRGVLRPRQDHRPHHQLRCLDQ